ncbi:glycoside hydrolase [Gorgonomyces haynaldii]|nr:glycoside hydrolase [Gorgonomyces haynaldii]
MNKWQQLLIIIGLGTVLYLFVAMEPFKPTIKQKHILEHDTLTVDEKRNRVVAMAKHTWNSYYQFASGFDELLPLSKTGVNIGSKSIHLTPVGALDTLYLMGLQTEYNQALELVKSLDPHEAQLMDISQVLGGLLGAYELSGNQILLEKAKKLGTQLLNCFQPNGLPFAKINLKSGEAFWTNITLGIAGSLGLEMQYLSDLTQESKFQYKALKAYQVLHEMKKEYSGLFPDKIFGNQFEEHPTYSAAKNAGSFYEYQLKLYIATKDERYATWHADSAHHLLRVLAVYEDNGKSVYLPKFHPFLKLARDMHFDLESCQTGGLFALGSQLDEEPWGELFEVGEKIAWTCYQCFAQSSTLVGGNVCYVDNDKILADGSYDLQPQVAESLFYLWRFTKDEKYRDMAFDIVKRLESLKSQVGFHALHNYQPMDRMPAHFISETLKYLFLTFDDSIDLDQFVFTANGHPLSIRGSGKRSDAHSWMPIPQSFPV